MLARNFNIENKNITWLYQAQAQGWKGLNALKCKITCIVHRWYGQQGPSRTPCLASGLPYHWHCIIQARSMTMRDNPQITSVIACMLNCPMVVFLRISPRKYLRKKWFSVWPLVTASSWQISWISPHISFLKICLLFNYYCIIRTICLAYRTDTSVYGDQSEGKPSLRLYTS